MDKQSGVYQILNSANGKYYIGGSNNIEQRFREHKSELRRGVHHNRYLQRAWDKYGEDAFQFITVGTCPLSKLEYMEQYILDRLHPTYNLSRCVEAPNRGRTFSVEHRRKLGLARRGKPFTEEHKRNLSLSQKGRKFTDEHKFNVAAAAKLRQPPTDATRAKLSRLGRGDGNGNAKLTWDNVRKIRALYMKGNITHRELAIMFGVGRPAISQIIRYEHWIED